MEMHLMNIRKKQCSEAWHHKTLIWNKRWSYLLQRSWERTLPMYIKEPLWQDVQDSLWWHWSLRICTDSWEIDWFTLFLWSIKESLWVHTTLLTMSAQLNAASQVLWCLTANNYTFLLFLYIDNQLYSGLTIIKVR